MVFFDHNYIIQFTVLKVWWTIHLYFCSRTGYFEKKRQIIGTIRLYFHDTVFLARTTLRPTIDKFWRASLAVMKKTSRFSIKITFHMEAIMQLFYDSGSGPPNYLVSVCEFIKAFCRQSLMLQINF